ncbi:MAG TPA: DNA polymerase III subunit beta [Candidatus Azoamicus sp. OHIO2]
MKIVIKNSKLLELLKKIDNVVDKSNKKSILSNILIKTVNEKIFCISINEYIEVVIYDFLDEECESFEFIVEHDIIYNILKKIKYNVNVIIKKERKYIEIFANNSVFKISHITDIFPSFEFDHNYIFKMKINTLLLLTILKNIKISISENNPQRFLNGVAFYLNNNVLNILSSDGFRLSYCNILYYEDFNSSLKLILPKITVNVLLNIFNMSDFSYIVFFGNQIKFITNNITLTSKLISDVYHIPVLYFDLDNSIKLILKTTDLQDALENIVSIKTTVEKADLFISKNKIVIKAGTFNQNVTVFLLIDHVYEDIELGFNYKHFREILKLLVSDFFEFIICNNRKFLVIKEENSNFLHVMMAFNI